MLLTGDVSGTAFETSRADTVLTPLACRNPDLNPQVSLEEVLRTIMSHPAEQVHKPLPDNWLASGKHTE